MKVPVKMSEMLYGSKLSKGRRSKRHFCHLLSLGVAVETAAAAAAVLQKEIEKRYTAHQDRSAQDGVGLFDAHVLPRNVVATGEESRSDVDQVSRVSLDCTGGTVHPVNLSLGKIHLKANKIIGTGTYENLWSRDTGTGSRSS